MNKRNLFIAVVALAVLGGGLVWYQQHALPDDVAATVDDTVFPAKSLAVIWRAARAGKPDVTRRQVLDGAIENHLIATRMEVHGEHEDKGSGRVGYDEATEAENELFRVLRTAFDDEIRRSLDQAGVGSPMAFLEGELTIDREALEPVLAVEQGLYHEMTPAQREKAKELELARFEFPWSQPESVSLWDIYRRQNVQLRVQLHNLNLDFLRQAIKQYLATQYVIGWFEHESGLTADEITAVRRMVRERLEKEERLHRIGLMADIHDDNEALKAVAANVSMDEISEYYEKHREEFTRVEKVRARHIRLNGQSQADAVYKRLQKGMAFEEAVKEFSVADDADAEKPGDLGWIDREARHDSWLRGIAFVQAEGRFSPPFRSPETRAGDVYWEIIRVDEKVTGYQPVDSEGVRYEASRAIAREKVKRRYRDLMERLRSSADIRVNEAVVGS